MVGQCMRDGEHFVVTMAWPRGLRILGVRCQFVTSIVWIMDFLGFWLSASEKQLFNPRQREDGLWLADTIDLPLESSDEVLVQHMGLVELLKSLQTHPTVRGLYSEIDYTDASEVSARLTELLPFDNEVKQSFFEMQDSSNRLYELESEVAKLQIQGESLIFE